MAWTSELASSHARGTFVAVEFTLALAGATIVYWVEYAVLKTQSLPFLGGFRSPYRSSSFFSSSVQLRSTPSPHVT